MIFKASCLNKYFSLFLLTFFISSASLLHAQDEPAAEEPTATEEVAPTEEAPAEASGDLTALATKGKSLFRGNCASCHKLDEPMTGPALKGVEARWEAAGSYEGKTGTEWLHEWIRNWQVPVDAGYTYANEIKNFDPSVMNAFPALTDEDIDAILVYVENSELVDIVATTTTTTDGAANEADNSNIKLILFFLVLLLLVIGLILLRVTSVLNRLLKEKRGEDVPAATPLLKNKKLWALVITVVVVCVGYVTVDGAIDLGRQQDYQPDQPIKYSHQLHAGVHQIPCQYCHSSAAESKHANIPSMNVCMNCHKNVKNGPQYGKSEISKIYASIGYNPMEDKYIENYEAMPKEDVQALFAEWLSTDIDDKPVSAEDSNKYVTAVMELAQAPIPWVRIHNLPDHVYFNHSQHVTAGAVECQTCHGPIEEMEVVYQHAPLSMGWCINCHRQTDVKFGSNDYYSIYEKYHEDLDEGKIQSVTVEDIGGTDCQKCHY